MLDKSLSWKAAWKMRRESIVYLKNCGKEIKYCSEVKWENIKHLRESEMQHKKCIQNKQKRFWDCCCVDLCDTLRVSWTLVQTSLFLGGFRHSIWGTSKCVTCYQKHWEDKFLSSLIWITRGKVGYWDLCLQTTRRWSGICGSCSS